jgi:hypothetical protein
VPVTIVRQPEISPSQAAEEEALAQSVPADRADR